MVYLRRRFYVEGPYSGTGRESIGCDTEEEVETALSTRPGWRVWEFKDGRGNMSRRTDLELKGGNIR